MNQQTVLPFATTDDAGLGGFYLSGNEPLIALLRQIIQGDRAQSTVFFWGASGSGKSHLLNACCHEAGQRSRPYRYLSANQPASIEGQAVADIAVHSLICVDDLQNLANNVLLQKAMLSLYEQVIDRQGTVIVCASRPLNRIGLELRDIESRLASGGCFVLNQLADEDKRTVLHRRARSRGIDLGDKVLDFIMNHYDRDTAALFGLLERIDSLSLSKKRKVTVPFVKSIL